MFTSTLGQWSLNLFAFLSPKFKKLKYSLFPVLLPSYVQQSDLVIHMHTHTHLYILFSDSFPS